MLLKLKLDGRKFRVDVRSAAVGQGDYLAQHLRAAGVTRLAEELKDDPGVLERVVNDLVTQILVAGQSSHVLAGCLRQSFRAWTRERADANAERFARITEGSEKVAMATCLAEFVSRLVLVWAKHSTTDAVAISTLQQIGV